MTQNDVDLTIPDRFNEEFAVFGIYGTDEAAVRGGEVSVRLR